MLKRRVPLGFTQEGVPVRNRLLSCPDGQTPCGTGAAGQAEDGLQGSESSGTAIPLGPTG